jgi:hypothetical protein
MPRHRRRTTIVYRSTFNRVRSLSGRLQIDSLSKRLGSTPFVSNLAASQSFSVICQPLFRTARDWCNASVASVSLPKRRDDRRHAQLKDRQLASFTQPSFARDQCPRLGSRSRANSASNAHRTKQPVSPDWNGPYLARLDAWFERRERILAEDPATRGQSQTLPQCLPVIQIWREHTSPDPFR